MARIFTTILILMSITLVNAQDILIKENGTTVNGQTLNFPVSNLNATHEKHLDIVNNTSSSMDIRVEKNVISEVSGSSNTFCWGIYCYPNFATVSDPQTITAGEVYSGFYGEYVPDNNAGITTIEYTFFEDGGSGPSETITVNYDGTVSIDEDETQVTEVYPNPAANSFKIEAAKANSEIRVFDIIGKEIAQFKNVTNEKTINCSEWQDGIYFIRIYNSGKLENTQRLTVSK